MQVKRISSHGIAILAVAILCSGCVYTRVQVPLDRDYQETQLGSRVGKSEARAILALVAWGDAGTKAAAEEGGIRTITHADQEIFAILGFVYTRITTIVYGE